MGHVDFLERTDARPKFGWRELSLGLAGGALLFSLGLWTARRSLPEWQLAGLPDRETAAAAFRSVVARAGLTPVEEPSLIVDAGRSSQYNAFDAYGARAAAWTLERRRPVMITARGAALGADAGRVELSVDLDLDGRPWSITVERSGFWAKFRPAWETALPNPRAVLLAEGETLGVENKGSFAGNPLRGADILNGPAEEALIWFENPKAQAWNAQRVPGTAAHALASSAFRPALVRLGVLLVLLLVVIVLAFVLAVRRRIDFLNAAVVTGAALLLSFVAGFLRPAGTMSWLGFVILTLFSAIYLFFLWSAGESWLRATGRETSSALDALRSGRVGRRVGRAVFWGGAVGAACAGWYLIAYGFAAFVPGGVPEDSSVTLPLLRPGATPLDYGFGLAGLVLLSLAVGRQFFRGRFAALGATLVGAGLVLPALSSLRPWPLALLFAIGLACLLTFAFERAGSLALAVAGVVTYLLPLFAFSLQSPDWFGSGLWSSAGLLVGLGAIGLVGALRPESVHEGVAAPEFVRRLDEEKRVQYETGMLARMQEGLLPADLPRVVGWDFAARTIQAHEVGGDFYDFFTEADGTLWVAAGDVAGHGISCSITHAMTKAALAALIRPGETPASVLGEVDRVLRTLTTSRLFTALALMRIDPATGAGLFANAGYPYPLQREGREIAELVLPGLPVGEGPARTYRDLVVQVPPGGALVFCSDGLAEALRADGEPYGFERPRQVLAAAPSRSATDLLEALTADWHREVGGRAEDDTTLLVLRRRG